MFITKNVASYKNETHIFFILECDIFDFSSGSSTRIQGKLLCRFYIKLSISNRTALSDSRSSILIRLYILCLNAEDDSLTDT